MATLIKEPSVNIDLSPPITEFHSSHHSLEDKEWKYQAYEVEFCELH